MDEEHIPINGTENQIKGAAYELQILNLIRQTQPAYLWPHTPETILIENGIIGSHNAARLKRKEERVNPLQQDTGIDIIAMSSDTECYLVQCKNGYKQGVSMIDLAGFMCWMASLPSKQGAVYYTNKLSLNVRTLPIQDRIKYNRVPFDTSYMPSTQITSPSINTNSEPEAVETAVLVFIPDPEKLEYQQMAKKAAIVYFTENDNGILSMPCGTGKTYTAYLIAQEFNKIFIVSPLKEFAKQNLDRFVEYGYPRKNTLLVDSDGCRDPEKIKKFMQGHVETGFLISATFDSVDVLWKVLEPQQEAVLGSEQQPISKTLFITDEFHNLSPANVLDEANDFNKIITKPGIKKLFMSATPRIYELEDTRESYEEVFGRRIYDMTFKYAIDRGFITDYRIWVPSIHEDLTDLSVDIHKELRIKDVLGSENILYSKSIYLFSCLVNIGSRKCIVYCQDIAEITQLRELISRLNEYYCLDINTSQITSSNSASSRRQILQEFVNSQKIELLFSVRILDECIDIPSCDSIYITYPSKSKIRTIQRLMRCTRTTKGNKYKVGNLFLWCSEYESILETLGGIKELDAKFEDKVIVNNVSQFTGRGVGKSKTVSDDITACRKLVIGAKEFKYVSWNDKLELVKKYIDENKQRPNSNSKDTQTKSLGSWISNQITNYKKKECIMSSPTIYSTWELFINNPIYSVYFLDNNTVWNNRLDDLKLYLDKNKKRPSENSKDPTIKFLGRWILSQMRNYKKKEQNMKDSTIYLTWETFINNPLYSVYFLDNNTAWNNTFTELKAYLDTHKIRPSVDSKDPKTKSLGKWFWNQTTKYRKKKQIMSDSTIYSTWEQFINNPEYTKYFFDNNTIWNNTLVELKTYLDINKMRPDKASEDPNIKTLGLWLQTQISHYRKKIQIMGDPTIYSAWETFINNPEYAEYFYDNKTAWNIRLNELKSYLDINKKRPLGTSEDKKTKSLGIWVSTQITTYTKKVKIMKDATIYSAWELFVNNLEYSEYFIDINTAWNNKLDELKTYLDTNKMRPSNRSKEPNTKALGQWFLRQINNYNKKTQAMKDTNIYSQFTTFMNHPDYKQYFNITPNTTA